MPGRQPQASLTGLTHAFHCFLLKLLVRKVAGRMPLFADAADAPARALALRLIVHAYAFEFEVGIGMDHAAQQAQ